MLFGLYSVPRVVGQDGSSLLLVDSSTIPPTDQEVTAATVLSSFSMEKVLFRVIGDSDGPCTLITQKSFMPDRRSTPHTGFSKFSSSFKNLIVCIALRQGFSVEVDEVPRDAYVQDRLPAHRVHAEDPCEASMFSRSPAISGSTIQNSARFCSTARRLVRGDSTTPVGSTLSCPDSQKLSRPKVFESQPVRHRFEEGFAIQR